MAKQTVDIEQQANERTAKLEAKHATLDAARTEIEKRFGRGSIMRMNAEVSHDLEVISSGSLLVDDALGIGGYPRGRIIEIYGPESSGKTTLSLHAIAETQKLGGVAAFVDAEHALDLSYAGNLGIVLDDLWMSQPDTGEQALEIVETLVRSNACDLIVVDSVAALTPQAEIDGDMGDSHMGLQARLMSQALRKLNGIISKSKAIVIFINQIRMKIGVMFGNPETTTGGKALKFYSSVRLEIRKVETVAKGKEDATGNIVRVKIVKNKVAPPYRKAELELVFGKGVCREYGLLQMAMKYDIVKKSGSWYSYGEERIGQGMENAKQFMRDKPEVAAEIEEKIRGNRGSKSSD